MMRMQADLDNRVRHQVAIRQRTSNRAILGWTAVAGIPALLDLPQQFAGLGLVALVAFPVVAAWLVRRTLIVSDPVVVVGIMWVMAAGLPALAPDFYADDIWQRLTAHSLDSATIWMYRAWAACSLAYWTIRSLPAPFSPPLSVGKMDIEDKTRVAIGLVGLAACVLGVLMSGAQSYSHLDGFSSTTTVDQIVHELQQLSKIYVFLFFFARGRGRLFPRERWLLYSILAIYVVIMGAAAAKGVIIELIAMWVLGNAAGAARGNVLKELVVGGIALTLLYFSFIWVTAYREELRSQVSAPSSSITEAFGHQVDAAGRAFGTVLSGDSVGGVENPYDLGDMLDRLAYVSAFSLLLDVTAAQSPYENAFESFLAPLYAILPRNLFDDKAQFFGSGEFAQLLGWQFGGFSVTLPGSIYWAWGFEGIVPAMLGLGAALAVLARGGDRDGPSGLIARVVLMCLVLALLNLGTNMQSIVVSSGRVALLTALIYMLVRALPAAHRRTQDAGWIGR